jgi:hypothetical protein
LIYFIRCNTDRPEKTTETIQRSPEVGNLIEQSEVYQNLIVPELRSINNALKDLKGGSCIKIDPRAADFFLNEFYRFNAFPMERLGNDLQYSDKIRFALRALVISVLIRMQEQLNLENSTSPQGLDNYTPETFFSAFPKLTHEEYLVAINFRDLLWIAWQFIDLKENNKWVLIYAISALLKAKISSKGGGQNALVRCFSEVYNNERENRINLVPQLGTTTSSTSRRTPSPYLFDEEYHIHSFDSLNLDQFELLREYLDAQQQNSRSNFSDTTTTCSSSVNNSGGFLLPNSVSHTSIFSPSTTTSNMQTGNSLYCNTTTTTNTTSSNNYNDDFFFPKEFVDEEDLLANLSDFD